MLIKENNWWGLLSVNNKMIQTCITLEMGNLFINALWKAYETLWNHHESLKCPRRKWGGPSLVVIESYETDRMNKEQDGIYKARWSDL